MTQYIDKSAVVAEIEKRKIPFKKDINDGVYPTYFRALMDFEDFIDTLEVKEIHEDIDVDLNPFFKELGIESDSRLASMFKKAFYEGIDKYLNKNENKIWELMIS